MDVGTFIALINPGMSLVFAAAFFLLWRHRRRRRYIAVLSASFLAIACAFLLQYFTAYSLTASRLVSNLLFLAGGVGLVTGGLGRFGRRPPLRSTLLFASAGFGVFLWYLLVDPDITMRIYAINFAFGAIVLVMAAGIGSEPRRRPVDNLLLALLALLGAGHFVRPVALVWIEGPYQTYEALHQSLYWMTMVASTSLFLVVFALSLISAVALDMMEELKLESQTDPLSGLLNRRGFEEVATQALRATGSRPMPATLVVCDLDHFKTVNDTCGHGCGDAVIAAFADCLRDCAGVGHPVGRTGGEEFAILLRSTGAAAGRLFAEGARAAIGALDMECLPPAMHLSASFGVAEWNGKESLSGLFSRADRALYEAKKAGRDRVRVSPTPPIAGGDGEAYVLANPAGRDGRTFR